MSRVLGIDAGGLGNPSWLAFLEDGGRVTLSQHVFTLDAVGLPWLDSGDVSCVAVDAPQGLPYPGNKRRECDAVANTPTRLLPCSRAELEAGRTAEGKEFAYIGPVRTGVAVFWAARDVAFGLAEKATLVETYPNVVFRRLAGRRPPPKSKRSFDYCCAVTSLMQREGVSCPGVEIPSVDQCDAILCALAAQTFVEGRAEALGLPPVIDQHENLIREGLIMVPDVIRHSCARADTPCSII